MRMVGNLKTSAQLAERGTAACQLLCGLGERRAAGIMNGTKINKKILLD
jgi:hypothetical protein